MLKLTTDNLLRNNAPLNSVRTVQANLDEYEFNKSEFGAVCALGSLEYLHDLPKVIARIALATVPGGSFLLSMPNLCSPFVWPERLARRLLEKIRPPGSMPWHRPTRFAKVRRMMKPHGFDLLEVLYTPPATTIGSLAFPPLSVLERMASAHRYPLAFCLANTWVAAFRKT
jgi:SAM-dependent methyltransferase